MLKSLHLGRYVKKREDLRRVAGFLAAIGFEPVASEPHRSMTLAAPAVLISINVLTKEYPREFQERLQDVHRLLVIEVTNPDTIFEVAQQERFEVLNDSVSATTGERSFSLVLPGEMILTVRGVAPESLAALEGKLDAGGKRFALVVARFNAFITDRLLVGALTALRQTGARNQDLEVMRVPGAFEIPSAARMLAESKKYDAIVCIGCLLRGDTAHYDVIVNEVTRGIGQSAQETGVPHAFGVLTCDTLEQAIDRAGLKMGNKGYEAALAAVEMASLQKQVRATASGTRKIVKAKAKRPTPKARARKAKPAHRKRR